MRKEQDRFRVELAGALTPELEGAAHSRAHGHRNPPMERSKWNRGERLSEKTDSPNGHKQP